MASNFDNFRQDLLLALHSSISERRGGLSERDLANMNNYALDDVKRVVEELRGEGLVRMVAGTERDAEPRFESTGIEGMAARLKMESFK